MVVVQLVDLLMSVLMASLSVIVIIFLFKDMRKDFNWLVAGVVCLVISTLIPSNVPATILGGQPVVFTAVLGGVPFDLGLAVGQVAIFLTTFYFMFHWGLPKEK